VHLGEREVKKLAGERKGGQPTKNLLYKKSFSFKLKIISKKEKDDEGIS